MEQSTILLVDDEQNILKSLSRLFLDEEYQLILATSGQEALDLIAGGSRPAVIVSDQRMPEMGGAEFLARAREKLPESVRMILTGYADINAAVDAVNRGGIFRYILKPWNDDDLKLAVRKALEHYNLVRNNKLLTLELREKNRQLEDMNVVLEEKVRLRTLELEQKIRELEARDKVQHHLLAFHPLNETLHMILEAMIQVGDADRATVWLADGNPDKLKIAAALRRGENGAIAENAAWLESEKKALEREVVKALVENKVLAANRSGGATVHECASAAIIPLLRDEVPLGAILIESEEGKIIGEKTIRSAESFAMQAAMAISDSRMHDNLPTLETCLDEILGEYGGR